MSDSKTHDPNQMTGAAMIVRALKDHGVKHIFGYPGGAVLPIYDEIFQQSDVEHILVRHEQGAGHAAEGHSPVQGIFPTQGSNRPLLHCTQILYQWSHQGIPSLKKKQRCA